MNKGERTEERAQGTPSAMSYVMAVHPTRLLRSWHGARTNGKNKLGTHEREGTRIRSQALKRGVGACTHCAADKAESRARG